MKKFLSLIFILLLLPCGCSKRQITDTKLYMDTVCTVTAECDEKTLDGAFSICENYERVFGREGYESELEKLNEKGELSLSDDLLEVIKLAAFYCESTDGKYDITLAPVISLWDFENQTLPDADLLSSTVQRVDYEKININGNTVTLNGTELDLGSIAKGYVADKVVEFLKEKGAENGIVNLGGNVKVFGKEYNVGIIKPFSDEILLTVKIKNLSAVTSGIYQRCFEKDGTLYHHILDSSTGLPIDNELASVTVLGECSAECDVLSTVCMLLGEKDAKKLINETDGYEAVFIKKDNSVSVSNGLKIKKSEIIYK